MDNDKNSGMEERETPQEEFGGDKATRARNRTVMLTPEITGQVRARLAQELKGDEAPPSGQGGEGIPGGFGGSTYQQRDSGAMLKSGLGAQQQPPAAPAQPMKATPKGLKGAVWSNPAPIVGFLVSFDEDENGEIFDLRVGRLIVTSEPAAAGNYMLINDNSVSPMHAIMRITSGGEIQVLDQLSEFGTKIKRFGSSDVEELSGEKSSIEHGDVIWFGERSFSVCVIAMEEE